MSKLQVLTFSFVVILKMSIFNKFYANLMLLVPDDVITFTDSTAHVNLRTARSVSSESLPVAGC